MTDCGHPDQRRIKNRRVNQVSSTAPGLSSRCIWKWRRKKTRSWPKAGKRMLMVSLYLCVSTFWSRASRLLINLRLVYSLPSSHRLYRCRFRAFNRTHKTHPTSTSRIYIRLLLPTQIDPIFQVPFPPPHPHSLHPRIPSGSTHFGS